MAEHHQNVLCVFALIHAFCGTDFLARYLHPEHSLKEYTFSNFNPMHLNRLHWKETKANPNAAKSNQERYIRVAFESLQEFLSKTNRRHEIYFDKDNQYIQFIVSLVIAGQYRDADIQVKRLFKTLANYIVKHKWSD